MPTMWCALFSISRLMRGYTLVDAGVDIYIIQDLFGHHSLKMMERYAKRKKEFKRKAVLNL